MAKDCAFGDFLDQALRDRFIAGLIDGKIRKTFFTLESKLSFKEVVEIASPSTLAKTRAPAPANNNQGQDAQAGGRPTPSKCSICKQEEHKKTCDKKAFEPPEKQAILITNVINIKPKK